MTDIDTLYKPQAILNRAFDDDANLIRTGLGLAVPKHDFVSLVISPSNTETYTFKLGGSSGTTVATIVIVYTDSSRTDISTLTKT